MKRPLALVFACASSLLFTTSTAHADDKDTCATAAESAQLMQHEGKLMSAREQALVCARAVCPAVVKQDCDALYASLEMTIPSLLIAVHDETGKDMPFATVSIDGVDISSASGQAYRVDPGIHVLHAQADKHTPTDQRVVVREGERSRAVVITLPTVDSGIAPPPPPHPVSPFVWVLGTLSVVSLAGFGVFEIEAVTDSNHFKHTCAPRCSDDNVSTVHTESTLGAISGIAAAAFAGGAVAIWLLDKPNVNASSSVRVGFSGTSLSVAGHF